MNSIIRANDLDVGYDNRTVVRDLNINALRGQTICLIGPNGAGKSTVLRTLAGMLAPIGGTVKIGRDDLHTIKPKILARQMAVVLTERLHINMATAYEIVAMGRAPYTGFFGRLSGEDHAIVRHSLHTVGADDLAKREFLSLSDGEKQKVLIARALAQQPSLIILDEPTSHLDIKHKVEVIRILEKLSRQQGLTVILALHDVDIALKSCQFVLMLKDGKVVAQGRPEDVVGDDTIRRLYDIEDANFDAVLGSLELCNTRPPDVFVSAGAGTGTKIYRLLSRMGLGIVTGILHNNDVDHNVAKAMKLTVIEEKSFEPISASNIRTAKSSLAVARFVVDAGAPIGTFNQENIQLLRESALEGKTIFSLRSLEDVRRLYEDATCVSAVSSAAQLEELVMGLHKK